MPIDFFDEPIFTTTAPLARRFLAALESQPGLQRPNPWTSGDGLDPEIYFFWMHDKARVSVSITDAEHITAFATIPSLGMKLELHSAYTDTLDLSRLWAAIRACQF